jgi:hypothetical protein
MSKVTTLGESQITATPPNVISIELVEAVVSNFRHGEIVRLTVWILRLHGQDDGVLRPQNRQPGN